MAAQSPASPTLAPAKKRARHTFSDRGPSPPLPSASAASPPTGEAVLDAAPAASGGKAGQSSNFRNVSACNRCRLRKNRCDQRLPSCASCEKAAVPCVGYDLITKREIPRSYVYYLETRVERLESLLRANHVDFPPAEDLEYCSRGANDASPPISPTETGRSTHSDTLDGAGALRGHYGANDPGRAYRHAPSAGLPGVANARHPGSTSGVSFARVVFAAVQSASDQRLPPDRRADRAYGPMASSGGGGPGTSMRDSFFGLHKKPTIRPATFPDRELGLKLVTLYFEHANPQIPVLHRDAFMHMFDQAYADEGRRAHRPRELYMLNMVFAIGGGIIIGDPAKGDGQADEGSRSQQCQPEEYHASAIIHLDACLEGSGGGLQELQAVLLLANFALLRPVAPGLWYIVGAAVRIAVDLGLHYEDGKLLETEPDEAASAANPAHLRELGRREYTRDLRRRLWWCTYSLDRLVSVCVGRPFGVSDQVVTTEFPSLLDDKYITTDGIMRRGSNANVAEASYKIVAHHYFRLRLLQSEILQVLQHQQTQIARAGSRDQTDRYVHTDLPSPFLSKLGNSFRSWRMDIDKRLLEWKREIPTQQDSGVGFSTEFLHLNYWQAIMLLYRQSLSVPPVFEKEYHTSKEVNSPSAYPTERQEDEERVYLKVAEAGQKILRLYRKLHLDGLVNYTYLATHHLFMAGISYLYAIWHSPTVRSMLSPDEVDFTVLAATSVFTALVKMCPPAATCRDAFERTAKATVRRANSRGGFKQDTASPAYGGQPSNPGDGPDRADRASWGDESHNSGYHHRARRSIDHDYPRPYEMLGSDGYSANPPSRQRHGRGPASMAIKTEPDAFPIARGMGNSDGAGPTDAAAVDPSLLPSPSAHQQQHATPSATGPINSPMSGLGGAVPSFLTPQPSYPFSPGNLNLSDLQGFDFLQDAGVASGADGGAGTGVDLGFGLGWEGLNHDFSDGQQVDLFDGFFFSRQQQGGGSGQ